MDEFPENYWGHTTEKSRYHYSIQLHALQQLVLSNCHIACDSMKGCGSCR